jgi:hypothetical protein
MRSGALHVMASSASSPDRPSFTSAQACPRAIAMHAARWSENACAPEIASRGIETRTLRAASNRHSCEPRVRAGG